MKKLMTLMLGLSFLVGTTALFAQNNKAETTKTTKKKAKKAKKPKSTEEKKS